MSEREDYKSIWKSIINGDVNALSKFYKQHYVGLINYGRTIIDDKEFVNNCFMELLIEFWDKRSALPEVENVRSYLMTSLSRVILHALKSDKRRQTKYNELKQLSANHQWSYEEHLVKLQSDINLRAKIAKALCKLTARQQELIRLKFFANLSYNEIAGQCGITKRTAYNIIYDGIRILQAELYEDQNSSFLLNLPIFFIPFMAYSN
jgi:RNA polymerase sigma factor (sigma-70 family)